MADGVIVFVGDSITDCDRSSDRSRLGHGYVDIVAGALRESGDQSTVVNAGVAGDRVAQLRRRWQTDVVDHRPSVLSISIGVNDTLVAFFEGRPTPTDSFRRDYTHILDRAIAAGDPRLVLVEPFFVGSGLPGVQDGGSFVRQDLAGKQAVVRDLAARYGAAFVPVQSIMDAVAAWRGPTVVAADGVHPTALGHRIIAGAWLTAYRRQPAR